MANESQKERQRIAITNISDLNALLLDCPRRRQQLVTTDSDVLRTHDWRKVVDAIQLDLSSLDSVSVNKDKKLALIGPGAHYSSLLSQSLKKELIPEFEPVLGIDFTMGDWAHESLRMISTSNSGIDGVIRNVKVFTLHGSFQTGFDTTPANGGGYDLTRLYMTSGAILGVPYEFAVPLRPVPEKAVLKTYAVKNADDALKAGIELNKTGYPRTVNIETSGLTEVIRGKASDLKPEYSIGARLEGSPALLESAEKVMDEIVEKAGGKATESSEYDFSGQIDPNSLNGRASLMGICSPSISKVGPLIAEVEKKAADSKSPVAISLLDVTMNSCILIPVLVGDGAADISSSIGSIISNAEIALRGNIGWNSILGDPQADPRLNLLRGIKQRVDRQMLLNPHVMGV